MRVEKSSSYDDSYMRRSLDAPTPPILRAPSPGRLKSMIRTYDDDESQPFDQRAADAWRGNSATKRRPRPTVGRSDRPFDEDTLAEPSITMTKTFPVDHHSPSDEDNEGNTNVARFRVPPPRLAGPVAHPSEQYRQGHPAADDEEEDDSLFDFQERRGKSKRNSRSKSRRPDHDDDSTSDVPISLQQRSHEAWKLKHKQARESPSRDSLNRSTVSFGDADEVHRYEREDNETIDNYTFSGRSLNSEYTKSMESEVEDAIKDILLIGKAKNHIPGRRKIRDNPRVKSELRDEDIYTDDEETLETQEEEKVTSRRLETKEEEDPLADAWGYVESGIYAVGAALGLDEDEEQTLAPSKSTSKSAKKATSAIAEKNTSTKSSADKLGTKQSTSFFDYLSEMLLGQSGSLCDKPDKKVLQEPSVKTTKVIPKAMSLEEDMRLIDLAVQAARLAHKLKGYEFDESYDLNIVSDIKFCVVDLSLPLGLVFQENDAGCFITKVLPDGSAARNGAIKAGDQLAGIDGASAINMTVDQIAQVVRKHNKSIELTFLRYVGPLRPAPGDLEEEGYEVKRITSRKAESTQQTPETRELPLSSPRYLIKPDPSAQKASLNTSSFEKPRPMVMQESSNVSRGNVSKSTSGVSDVGSKRRFRLFGKKR